VILKIRNKRVDNHVHAVFFMGDVEHSLANLGTLIFTVEEWEVFANKLENGIAWTMLDDNKNTKLVLEEDAKPWTELAELRKPLDDPRFTGRKIRP